MKKVLAIVVGLLVLIAIPVTVFVVGQRQELRKRAAPATTLALTPQTVTKSVGDTFSLDVSLDPGTNQVIAVEIHLAFDPEKLEAQTITNSSLFTNILTSGVVDRGTAAITVGAADTRHPITQAGTAAVVRFKALARTDAPISVRFSPNTQATGIGEATNVLVGTTPATITITGAAVTPSPTTTITPTPTRTATPTATLTPTLTPTQTATSSATSSAITVTTPTNSSVVSSKTPTFKGKALPGATVTLTIYSTPQTIVVTADANGNWTYTSTTPLPDGPHSIVASSQDASGQTKTATISFVVTSSATQSAIPVSGDVSTTYLLVAIGTLLLLAGLAVPAVIH